MSLPGVPGVVVEVAPPAHHPAVAFPITASILYDLVQCPYRVKLDAFGDPARREPTNAFVSLLWRRGALHEKEVLAGLVGHEEFVDLSRWSGDEKEAHTAAAMQAGVPLIYAGRIRSGELLGEPDLLRREIGGYVPGDIKSGAGEEGGGDDADGKPKTHYAVQLGLYVDALERLGLSAGRRGFIWDVHGEEVVYDFAAPRGPRSPETLWDLYEAARALAAGILAGDVAVRGAYTAACKLCHWYSFCIEELTAADDLTLIAGLGRSIRDALWERVPTVADLAAADPGAFMAGKKKTVFQGVGPDRLALFHRRARLLRSDAPHAYLTAPLAMPASHRELFFDVEVDPLRDVCYLHGFVERLGGDNATERFVAFFAEAPTRDEERRAFGEAWAFVRACQPWIVFYYSKYERTVYRRLQARYPDVCSPEDIEWLFDRDRSVDLYGDVVVGCTEWPTRDFSIKTLARHLGFVWRDPHPSGAASIEWYDRWVRTGDPDVRQRILDYNEDDCRATRVLLEGVMALPV